MNFDGQEQKPSQEEEKKPNEEQKEVQKPNPNDMFNFDNFQAEIDNAQTNSSNQTNDLFSFNFGETQEQ